MALLWSLRFLSGLQANHEVVRHHARLDSWAQRQLSGPCELCQFLVGRGVWHCFQMTGWDPARQGAMPDSLDT